RDGADGLARDGQRGDPPGGRGIAEAGDRPGAGGLGEADDGRVVPRLEVAVGVADFRGERLRRAGGDARRIAGEGEVVGGAGGDGEARGVARQTRLRSRDRDRAGGLTGDGERGDAAGSSGGAEAGDRAAAGGLGERNYGRVVPG